MKTLLALIALLLTGCAYVAGNGTATVKVDNHTDIEAKKK